MAGGTFNPQANLPQAQDFLNYSRGYRDTSTGDFLTGLAGDVGTGIKAVDQGLAQKAEDDVRSAVESTDTQLLGIKNQGPSADPLESEVKSQVQNLADKKLAMDAGTIDPQHYYATIQAKVKDIRARYSGYNDTIDSELQKLGIDPNWQRKQIIEEGIKAQNAKAAAATEFDKDQREFYEKALTDPKLLIDPELRQEMVNNPTFWRSPTNMTKLRAAYAKTNAIYSNLDARKAAAETDTAVGKSQADAFTEVYSDSLTTGLYAGVYNSGAYKTLQDAIKKAQDSQLRGEPVSAEDEQQIRLSLSQFVQAANAVKLNVKAKFAQDSGKFQEGMKKADDAFDAMVKNTVDAINNKDYGPLVANTTYLHARVNEKATDMSLDDHVAIMSAAKDLIGDPALGALAQHDPGLFDPITKHWTMATATDQIVNARPLIDAQKKMRDAGFNDPKAFKSTYQQSIDLILNKDAKIPGRLNMFDSMFGPDNKGFWDNLKKTGMDDNSLRQYYRQMTSPQMQSAVNELAKYDRSVRTKYYEYSKYMFQVLNQNTASTVNDVIHNSSSATVTYDPETMHLKLTPVPNPNGTIVGNWWDSARGGATAIQNFNDGIDAVIPLMKDSGADPSVAVPLLLQNMGVDLNGTKQGNLIDRTFNQVYDWWNNSQPPQGSINLPPVGSGWPSPSKLGGPQAAGQEGYALNVGAGMANRGADPGVVAANAQELREMLKLYGQTQDPEARKEIKSEIDRLRSKRDITDTLTNQDRSIPGQTTIPKNTPDTNTTTIPKTIQGQDNSGWSKYLNNPDTSAIDFITNVPSFVDAVKSGDPKEIATQAVLAAATIIPFPVKGLLKGAGEATKVAKGAGELVDATTLEIRRAEKGVSQHLDELSNLSKDQFKAYKDFVDSGLSPKDALTQAKEMPKSLEDVSSFIEKHNLDSHDAALYRGLSSSERAAIDAELAKGKVYSFAGAYAEVKGGYPMRESAEDITKELDKAGIPYTSVENKVPGNSTSGQFSKDPNKKTWSFTRMNPDGSIDKYDGLTKTQVEALQKRLKVIEGGSEGSGKPIGNLRPVDEPSPKGLSANAYNPEVFTTAGKAQRATEEELTVRNLVRKGISERSISNQVSKGNKYIVVDNKGKNGPVVIGGSDVKDKARTIANKKVKATLDPERFTVHKVD